MTEPLDHHDALVFAMVTTSAVDRTMTDKELARIGQIVSHLPVFTITTQEPAGQDRRGLRRAARHRGRARPVLLMISSAVPKKLRETAYAVALEVAAADST